MRGNQDTTNGVGDASLGGSKTNIQRFIIEGLTALGTALASRGDSYSDITDNASVFIDALKGHGVEFPSKNDTAMYCNAMIQAKLARLACSGWNHQDSVMDIAGFAILWLAQLKRMEANK